MHGLIFETSVCYWQNQPGCYLFFCSSPSEERKNPKRQGSFHFSLRKLRRGQTKGMRCFLYKFQSIANTELIINEVDENIQNTWRQTISLTSPAFPWMFCSLSCRVITFYRQKAETYSCDKCFPRKETSFKKGSVGFYAQTEIEFFSLLVFTHPIRFSVCMATRF